MATNDGEGEHAENEIHDDADAVVSSDNVTENGQVEAADGQPQQEAPPQQSFFAVAKTLIVRCLIIYFISSMFRRSPTPPATAPDGSPNPVALPAQNIFNKGLAMDMYVYISEQEHFKDFDNKAALFWLEEELMYGDWESGQHSDGSYVMDGKLPLSEKVINNGTIFMHVYFVKSGKSPNPEEKDRYSKRFTVYRSKQLNKYKKRVFHTTVNLLTGTTDVHPDLVRKPNETKFEILSHWHPNITINIIDDNTPWVKGSVPAPLDEYIEFEPGTNKYYPIVFYNDYWNLNKDYMPINETTPVLNISVTFAPMSLFKWQMYAAQGMRNRWYNFMGSDMMEESDEDQDSLKTTLVETNPYLLALTIVVSLVHSVFEFLAFKNDIQFWRNKKTLEGLSVRSVFFNVFQSFIIVLYVMDNETNFVVRVSVFIGLAIEMWKIHKVVDVKVDRENKLLGIIPRIKFEDKSTYTQSETKKYDMLAFRYLSVLLFPLLVAYSVYSLTYNEHRGWYSYTLNMVYGFLLTFGFIMMTPQLFINYKLKSVAHLPWRMLTYKALNTFIDDLFAFVIKMPTLYRIGCFRDDIIFLIFLYQKWIYPIDYKRVNEFGYSADDAVDQPNGEITTGEGEEQPNGEIKALGEDKEEQEQPEDTSKPGANGDGPSPAKPKSKKAKKVD